MNKRVFASFLIFCFVFSFIVALSFISAQTEPSFASTSTASSNPIEALKSLGSGFLQVAQPFFSALLGDVTGTKDFSGGQILFAKVLFLLVIFAVVWSVVDKMPIFSANAWLVFLISAAVSLLSTRFLTDAGWVQTILLPYSAFGIAVTSFIPLLIYFYFVLSLDSAFLRKTAWILAAVIFIGLWATRYKDIGNALWVYPAAAVLCLIFFIADGTIQRAWAKVKTGKALSPTMYALYGKYMKDIEGLIQAQSAFKPSDAHYKTIETQIKDLRKKAADILAKASS